VICSAPRSLPPTTTTNTRTPPDGFFLLGVSHCDAFLRSHRLHRRNSRDIITYFGRPRFFRLSVAPKSWDSLTVPTSP
jgi:hypothetical protein